MNQIYACRKGKEIPFYGTTDNSTATAATRSGRRNVFSKLLLGFFVFLVLGAAQSWGQGTRTFPTSGVLVVPPGVTSINIDATGAGGGGAGSIAANRPGGGGAGAGFVRSINVPVVPGTLISVIIGTGGTGGIGANSGTNGGLTTVTGTGINISIPGGNGGVAGPSPLNTGGLGVAPSGGNTSNFTGGDGGDGSSAQFGSGGGGGGSASAGGGGTAGVSGTPDPSAGGAGGSLNGGQGGASGNPFGGNGQTATGIGGGGGGAGQGNLGLGGGDGGNGQAVITWTCATYNAGTYGPFCQTDAPVPLSGTPATILTGPIFAGPGVVGAGPGGQTFNPATAGPGCHTITYTYTDANVSGCTMSASTQILVYPTAPTIADPADVCAAMFTLPTVASQAGNGFTTQYSIDGGTFATNPSTTTPGCHTIQARYVNTAACGGIPPLQQGPGLCGVSNSHSVLIYPTAPNIADPADACNAMFTLPTVASQTANGFTTQYRLDGGTFQTNPSTTTPGCHTIEARYVNTNACDGTAALSQGPGACGVSNLHSVLIYPTAPVIQSPAPVCQGGTFVLPTVASQAGNGFTTQYEIAPPAGFSAAPVLPVAPGLYTITARYVNTAACDGTPALTQGPGACGLSNAVPAAIVATPTMSDPADQSVCCTSVVTTTFVSPAGVPPGGTFSYDWVNSNTNIGLGANGTSTGTLTFTAQCNPNTETGNITVTPKYTYTIAGPGGGTITCSGPTQTYSVTVWAATVGIIQLPANSTICAGQDGHVNVNLNGTPPFNGVFSIFNNSTAAFMPNYGWTSNIIGGPQDITVTATNLPNNTNSPITYTIGWVSLTDAHCTATAGNLQGATNITVNPLPQLQISRVPAAAIICPGTPIVWTVSPAAGNTVPSTFNYTITETGNVVPLQQGSNQPYGNVNFTAPSCPYNKTLTFTATPVANQSPNCPGTTQTNTVLVQDITGPSFGTSGGGTFDRCDANGIATARGFTPTATNTNCTGANPVVTVQTAETYTPTCGYTAPYAAGKTGTLTTVYLATEPCGATNTITKTIIINDNTVPTWTNAPGSLNQTVQYCDNAALNNAQTNFTPTPTDGCASPIAISVVRTSGVFAVGSCPHQGTITNTWIATDACGNASAQFTQVITIVDQVGPTFTGPATTPQTLNVGAQANCSGTLPNYILGTGNIPPHAALVPIGATDCAAPGGLFPAPQPIVYNNNNQGVNLIWQNPAPGITVFGPGGTIIPITIFARDACGNLSQTQFNVTIVDETAPNAICRNLQNTTAGQANSRVILNNAGQFVLNFTSTVSQINNGSNDACNLPNQPITLSFAQATVVPTRTLTCSDVPANSTTGTVAVTMWVTDFAGNQSSCTSQVDVVENIPPVFTNCPTGTQFVTKDAGCSATVPDYITLLAINATDACTPVTYTQNPLAGSVVGAGVGTIPVTITARDVHGNTTPCTFNVTFRDLTPPSFGVTCPTSQVLSSGPGSCSTSASWTTPTATDNCSPSNGLGPITYTVTATGTTTPPVLSPVNPGAAMTATFFVGTTTVTYTATDQAGNAQTCIFTITVNDNTNPVVTCPTFTPGNGNLNNVAPFQPIMATDPGVCTFTKVGTSWDATATDNCLLAGPNPLVYRLTRPPSIVVIGTGTSLAGVVFDKGITRVTWVATDFSGNQGTCTYDVEVRDLELPTLTCPANVVTTPNVPNCRAFVLAALTNATSADNCPGAVVTWDVSGATPIASGSGNIGNFTFWLGTTNVQYKITDAAGNFRTCSFTVTVNPAIDATISGNAIVGQNVNNTSTVTFTGSGAGAVPPAQVQYTFTYNITSNVAPPQNGLTVTTGPGSNVTTVAQSNATVGNYTYTLVSVTDQNGCTKVFPNPQPSVLIQVVPGVPDLTTSYQASSTQIQSGGSIVQVFGIRNVGTVATSGTIVFTVTNYNPAFGGLSTVAPTTNGTVIIGGTPFNYQNNDWTITGTGTSLLTFTSKALVTIPAGGVNIIRVDITRAAAGAPGNSNGAANETLTIAPGTGGGETPTSNNSFSTTITKN